MKAVLPAALLIGASPAAAISTPAQQGGASTSPAATAPLPRRIEGLSEAGAAIFAKAQAAPDPDLLNLVRKQRSLRDQLAAAAASSTVDVTKVTDILHQQEDVQAQIRVRNNARMLAVLRQLPEADRAPFLRGVLNRPVAR